MRGARERATRGARPLGGEGILTSDAPGARGAASQEGSMLASSALSPLRTLMLGLLLTVAIAAIVLAVVTVIGFLGSFLVDRGVVTFARLTSVPSIVTVVFVGSLAIAGLVCFAVDYTFVRPLRRMTAAMGRLAAGDFGFRVRNTARFRVREVDEFARSFNRAAEELAGTEMMRGSFISDFSHEFRTPINSLSGFAQLLRDDDGSLTDEERREYLGIIVDESQRLAGLSERILALSKMEAVSIVPDVGRVDVAEQLRRAVLLVEPKSAAKGVFVSLSLDDCTVRGNADYLMQLWTNLLDNAVKFSPEGGAVDVALYGGRQGEEGRAGSSAGDEAVCWISDEGCGMDEETRRRLFEKFYQGDTSHASEGSGLGLALAKRIVDLHGGSIEVQSSPGHGSVFEVRLPIV